MDTNDFLIRVHQEQLMHSPEKFQNLTRLANDKYALNLITRLMTDKVQIFTNDYQPIQNYLALIQEFYNKLNITLTREQINFIVEQVYYPQIIYLKLNANVLLPPTELWEHLNTTLLNSFINQFIKTNLSKEQTSWLCMQLLHNLTIYHLDNNKLPLLENAYHLLSDHTGVNNKLKNISGLKNLEIDEYYIIVRRTFKSLFLINSTIHKKHEINYLTKKLETLIKVNNKIIAMAKHDITAEDLSRIDSVLAQKYQIPRTDYKSIHKKTITAKAILARIKVQKSGILSESMAIKRTIFSLFFLAQYFGIEMHDEKHNYEGNALRKFTSIILGKNLYDIYRPKIKTIYREYRSNTRITNAVNSLISNANSSSNYFDTMRSADETFSSFITESC